MTTSTRTATKTINHGTGEYQRSDGNLPHPDVIEVVGWPSGQPIHAFDQLREADRGPRGQERGPEGPERPVVFGVKSDLGGF